MRCRTPFGGGASQSRRHAARATEHLDHTTAAAAQDIARNTPQRRNRRPPRPATDANELRIAPRHFAPASTCSTGMSEAHAAVRRDAEVNRDVRAGKPRARRWARTFPKYPVSSAQRFHAERARRATTRVDALLAVRATRHARSSADVARGFPAPHASSSSTRLAAAASISTAKGRPRRRFQRRRPPRRTLRCSASIDFNIVWNSASPAATVFFGPVNLKKTLPCLPSTTSRYHAIARFGRLRGHRAGRSPV